jgi:hypothetical protein
VVTGSSAGHGAITALLSDLVIMLEKATIFAAGPALVAAATGEVVSKEDLGGARIHATQSGVAHNVVPDEAAAFALIRSYLALLPSSAWAWPPARVSGDAGQRRLDAILHLVPRDAQKPYDMRAVVRELLDDGETLELQPQFGRSLLTVLGRLGGETVAVLANQPMFLAGSVDRDAADKAARFLQVADAFHVPVIFLADNPGILSGSKAERAGTLRAAARMFMAQSQLRVPKLHVTLRKAYGFGSSIMAMNPFDGQTLAVAFPGISLGGMPAAGGAEAAGLGADERRRMLEAQSGGAWSAGDTLAYDEIIDPRELRNVLLAGLRTALSRRAAPGLPGPLCAVASGPEPVGRASARRCRAQHVDVRDAVLVVGITHGDESERAVEMCEVRLRGDADRHAAELLRHARLPAQHELAPEALVAERRRRQHAADGMLGKARTGQQHAQVRRDFAFAGPGRSGARPRGRVRRHRDRRSAARPRRLPRVRPRSRKACSCRARRSAAIPTGSSASSPGQGAGGRLRSRKVAHIAAHELRDAALVHPAREQRGGDRGHAGGIDGGGHGTVEIRTERNRVLAEQGHRGIERRGDPRRTRVADRLGPEADPDEPAARRDALHQRIGNVARTRAMAVGAGVADQQRRVGRGQHVLDHRGRGMRDVDHDPAAQHLGERRAPELAESRAGGAMQRAAERVVEEVLQAHDAKARLVKAADVFQLPVERMGSLGAEHGADGSLPPRRVAQSAIPGRRGSGSRAVDPAIGQRNRRAARPGTAHAR